MNVKNLRTLVDNLDEYIHVPGGIERLKKTILHLAVSGQLVPQDPSEGTGDELYEQIQAEKAKLTAEGKLKKQKSLPEISEEEVPFNIPENWRWVRLGKISKIISKGTTPSGGKVAYVNNGIKFVRAENVGKDGHVNLRDSKYITQQMNDGPLSRSVLEAYDLLISIAGTLGRSSIVDPEQLPLNTNQAVSFTRLLNTQLLNPWFFQKTVASPQLQNLLVSSVKTTAIPNLTLEIISNFIVPMPPESEQRRIVKKIELVFALIDTLITEYKDEQHERRKLVVASLSNFAKNGSNLALNQLTDIIKTKEDAAELRKTILHLAVSGQLVPQDPSEGTGEGLYQQIQAEKAELVKQGKIRNQKTLPQVGDDEIPFEIPLNWKWTSLGRLGVTVTGKTPSTSKHSLLDGDIPFVGPGNISKNNLLTNNYQKWLNNEASESSELAMKNDILMVCIGGSIGKTALVDAPLCFNQQINKISPIIIEPQYLFIVLTSEYFQRMIINSAVGGATPIINQTRWAKLPISLPPLAEQKRIVANATQLLDLVTELEGHLAG